MVCDTPIVRSHGSDNLFSVTGKADAGNALNLSESEEEEELEDIIEDFATQTNIDSVRHSSTFVT